MGIFKKNKGTRLGDGERKKGQVQLKDILEAGPADTEPLAAAKASPKARGGFFKSQNFRRKNKFHRLSSSAGTPRNGYEPPNVAVFFSDDGSVAASSLTQTTAGFDIVENTLNARFIKTSMSKDQATKLIKNLTSGKEAKTPDGFQKLNDDESLHPKGTVSFDSDGIDEVLAISTLEPRKGQVDTEQVKQKQTDGQYDFDCLLQTNLPFSDLMDSKSSGSIGENKSYESGDSVKKPSHLVLDEKSTAESTVDKFSEAGSSEFRQFVFDKKFSRIETVAVEKSDSGVAETFMSAAAILTSKLGRAQAGVIDQYSPSPGFPRSTPNSVNRQSFRVGESPVKVQFPSPKFPSPSVSKQSDSQHASKAPSPFVKTRQSQFSSPLMEKRDNNGVVNKVSNDSSDHHFVEDRELPTIQTTEIPPESIVASSEQTIVSNMSATHATADMSAYSSENVLPFNAFRPPSGIPEVNEQDEDNSDPFHVGTLSENDDTLWEPSEDPFDFSSSNKFDQSMSRDNSALIDSIRKASSRDQSSVHRPDPSPKSIIAPVPDPEGVKSKRTALKHVEKHMDKHMESMYKNLQQKKVEESEVARDEPKTLTESTHHFEGSDENAGDENVWSEMRLASEEGRPSRPSTSTPESVPGKQFGIAKKEQFFAGNISRDDRLPFSPSSFQNRSRADKPRITNPTFLPQENTLEDHFKSFKETNQKNRSRGASSIKSNPSGVPTSAIAASMLFQTAHSQSSKADPQPPNSVAKDRDHAKNVPPDVELDNLETVSSITEEASTFYKNNFQMWSRTATDALNKIQKGAFPRNPNSYQYGHQ